MASNPQSLAHYIQQLHHRRMQSVAHIPRVSHILSHTLLRAQGAEEGGTAQEPKLRAAEHPNQVARGPRDQMRELQDDTHIHTDVRRHTDHVHCVLSHPIDRRAPARMFKTMQHVHNRLEHPPTGWFCCLPQAGDCEATRHIAPPQNCRHALRSGLA